MRDVTNYPLSSNQRKVSVTDALEMVKEENPNVELTNETLKFYLDEVMKKSCPKPNPKFALGILIKYVKPIPCPHCGYEIEIYGFNNALNVELIEDKKSAIMCPMCFTPFEK